MISIFSVVAVLIVMTIAFEKPQPNACAQVCAANYDPVCGGIPNSQEKPKSFGNSCVLDNYNCEHNTSKNSDLFI